MVGPYSPCWVVQPSTVKLWIPLAYCVDSFFRRMPADPIFLADLASAFVDVLTIFQCCQVVVKFTQG